MDASSSSMPHLNRYWILAYSFLLNIPINYHPMNLLPSLASYPSNIADLFTKPLSLSRHRFTTTTLIGDLHSPTPTTSVVSTVDSVPVATTVVASAPTAATASDSVLPTLPIALDAGTPLARTPFSLDFALDVFQAPYGLIRSAASVANSSSSKRSSKATLSNDPYTLITGEDTTVDLTSSDTTVDSDSVIASAFEVLEVREFGTATLIFISHPHLDSELESILVEPTLDWTDTWLDWIPLPRLILSESYFHIFGLDYLQAFTLLHLIPIWIYCLLHFAVNLE